MKIISENKNMVIMEGQTVDDTVEMISLQQVSNHWFVIRDNEIINHSQYRNDMREWLNCNIWACGKGIKRLREEK